MKKNPRLPTDPGSSANSPKEAERRESMTAEPEGDEEEEHVESIFVSLRYYEPFQKISLTRFSSRNYGNSAKSERK